MADTEQIIPHYSQRAHIQALDPLLVNPNSYDSVKLALRKIGIISVFPGIKMKPTQITDSGFLLCVMVYHTVWPISLYIMHIIASTVKILFKEWKGSKNTINLNGKKLDFYILKGLD